MSRYHDDDTSASHPGSLLLDRRRFRRLQPETQGLRGVWHRLAGGGRRTEAMLDEHMQLGDSRAAIVVSTEPLLVAAYSSEIDCVVLLLFPTWLVGAYGLAPGTRLLTVNTYARGTRFASDLVPGPGEMGRWKNFFPVIAEFVSDNPRRIEARKAEIEASEWERCQTLGQAAVRTHVGRWRDGSPLRSARPGQSWM